MKITRVILAAISLAIVEALVMAEADPRRNGIHWFCGVPGAGCKHRSAELEERPLAARQSILKGGLCDVPGEICTTLQHSAKAVRDALADRWTNYDAPKTDASALCDVPGGKCAMAREAIGDISETAEEAYHELIARKAKVKRPTIYIGGATTWFCGVLGMSCAKKRLLPAINKRNDDAATSAANALNDADPEVLQTGCTKDGNECHSLLNAYIGFHQAKREAEDVQNLAGPGARQACCSVYGCDWDTEEYLRYLQAGDPEAKQIENNCYDEDGECMLARRALDGLERALDEAISKIA